MKKKSLKIKGYKLNKDGQYEPILTKEEKRKLDFQKKLMDSMTPEQKEFYAKFDLVNMDFGKIMLGALIEDLENGKISQEDFDKLTKPLKDSK